MSSLELLFNPLGSFFDCSSDCSQTFKKQPDNDNVGVSEFEVVYEKASVKTGITHQESSEEPDEEDFYNDDDGSFISDLTFDEAGVEQRMEKKAPTPTTTSALPTPRRLEFQKSSPPFLPAIEPNRRKKYVWFTPMLSVALIPSRHEYSDEDRAKIWSNFDEVHFNATRNRIEYQYEGHDWRNVLEEQHMYLDSNNGELVHPAILEFVNLWWHRIGNPIYNISNSSTTINESLLNIVYNSTASKPQRRIPIIA
jgi:hypothetical protein